MRNLWYELRVLACIIMLITAHLTAPQQKKQGRIILLGLKSILDEINATYARKS